jgi:hypothetical protein
MQYLHAWGLSLYLLSTGAPTDNENGVVFSAAEFFSSIYTNRPSIQSRDYLVGLLDNLKVSGMPGIYNRYDNEIAPTNDISHDNMTAIAVISHELGLQHHVDIYKYGKRYLFRYDNLNPTNPRWSRIFDPRDWALHSLLNKGYLGYVLMPYFYTTQLFTCAKKFDVRPQWWKRWFLKAPGYNKYLAVSGKQMAFIRLMSLRKTWHGKLAFDICTKLVNNSVGGWKVVFDTYYKNDNHPVRNLWHLNIK